MSTHEEWAKKFPNYKKGDKVLDLRGGKRVVATCIGFTSNPSSILSPDALGREKESRLHGEIFDRCRELLWIPFHGSMAARTHRTEGEPDFIIAARGWRCRSCGFRTVNREERCPDGKRPNSCGDDRPEDLRRSFAFTLYVECKSRTGKLRPTQAAMEHHLAILGHVMWVVRSMEDFEKAIAEELADCG